MKRWVSSASYFDKDKLNSEMMRYEAIMRAPTFWDDVKKAQQISIEHSRTVDRLKSIRMFVEEASFLKDYYPIVERNDNFDFDFERQINIFLRNVENYKTQIMLNGKHDDKNAIVSISAGAGGTESMDWAEMLYKMYTSYANKNKLTITVLDTESGQEAGIKNIQFMVKGEFSYGLLKNESGVHRLVRISPFDANSRRHTSFASVEVSPNIDEEPDIIIDRNDLRIDTFRSSGAGGQHVNKTESAIRLTHLPTGIVVSCQNERSAMQNREQAYKMLYGKLVAENERKMQEERDAKNSKLKKIEWGSQIRSYVFCPYTLVKDHRTNFETSDVVAVMGGEINEFIIEMIKLQNDSE